MSRKTKEFQKLEDFWYSRLAAEGFKDAETSEYHLEYWHSHRFRQQNTPESFKAKETYYQWAGQFLHSHVFDSPFEETVWARHAEGLSSRDIAREFKYVGRHIIDKIVNRLSKLMLAGNP